LLPDDVKRLVVHGIVGVLFYDLENLLGTSGHTIAATIAFVRINGDEIVARPVSVTVVRQLDVFPVSLLDGEPCPNGLPWGKQFSCQQVGTTAAEAGSWGNL